MCASIGLAFSLYIVIRFIDQLGKTFPLKELIVLLAALQWIIGAKISYGYEKIHYKYFMYVEEQLYMSLVVPSIILLYLGLVSIKTPNLKFDLERHFAKGKRRKGVEKIAKSLFSLGILGIGMNKFLSLPSLAFIFFMFSLLVYVSIGYFFYLYPNKKTLIFTTALIVFFLQALAIGMFHNFFLMAIFLFGVYVNPNKSFIWKSLVLLIAVLLVNGLQVIKQDYRSIIWESKNLNQSKAEIFVELMQNQFITVDKQKESIYIDKREDASEEVEKVTTRINQGWIISKIMDYVPRKRDFLKGESVTSAITASVLPRFLFPDKTSANDAKKIFEKVTGLNLLEGTSLGLSLVGEFYANFGMYGAWFAMLIYGLFISFFLRIIIYFSNDSPFLVLWFVLIFFQVIKAETYLIKILNHLIKASMFVFVLHFLLKSLGLNIFPDIKYKGN